MDFCTDYETVKQRKSMKDVILGLSKRALCYHRWKDTCDGRGAHVRRQIHSAEEDSAKLPPRRAVKERSPSSEETNYSSPNRAIVHAEADWQLGRSPLL